MFRREYDDLCVRDGESGGFTVLFTDLIVNRDADTSAARHDERESHLAFDQRNRRRVRTERLHSRSWLHRRFQ
jgi:hypothetical protein